MNKWKMKEPSTDGRAELPPVAEHRRFRGVAHRVGGHHGHQLCPSPRMRVRVWRVRITQ